jgi:hypothetical protein
VELKTFRVLETRKDWEGRVAPRQGRTQGAGRLIFVRARLAQGEGRGQERAPPFFSLGGEAPGEDARTRLPHRNSGKPAPLEKRESAPTRKPTLLFLLSGLFLFRSAQRAFL